MKTAILLLFLSFYVYTISSLAAAAFPPEPVLDAAGKILRTDAYYYILPANVHKGRGGGLTLASTSNYTCPLGVVQEQYESREGLPVKFYPMNVPKGVTGAVHVSTDMNIQFSFPESCGQSTVWSLEGYDELLGEEFVGVGGILGNPGAETLSNWFRIEKYGYGYKLLYCPTSVCSYCDVVCKDVGIFNLNGKRRLVLSDTPVPFKIMFKQA